MEYDLLNQIPDRISDSEVLDYLRTRKMDWSYITLFKEITDSTDEMISGWLNISVRTFRNYKNPENKIRDQVKEQLLLLLSLFKYGREVFGTSKDFNHWLDAENFYFDGQKPVSFLNTVTGIKYIRERLTGLEYGDNA